RHTRFSRDWSSDVCSSDLASLIPSSLTWTSSSCPSGKFKGWSSTNWPLWILAFSACIGVDSSTLSFGFIGWVSSLFEPREGQGRSEERRVGKGGGERGGGD